MIICFRLLVLIIVSCRSRCCKTETTRLAQRIPCGPSFATKSVFLTTKKNAPATIKERFFKTQIHGWIVIPLELLASPCSLSMMLSTRLLFVSAKESMECRTVSRRHKRSSFWLGRTRIRTASKLVLRKGTSRSLAPRWQKSLSFPKITTSLPTFTFSTAAYRRLCTRFPSK